nr:hypothetical protein 19 [bacterium]
MAKKSTMTVRIPGTGRELTVPKGLSGDALARHVQGVLEAEATAAAEAQAAALAKLAQEEAAAEAAVAPEMSRQQMQDHIDSIEFQLQKLNRELDDANHRLKLKQNTIDDLDAALQLYGTHAKPVEQVVDGLATRKEGLDEATAAKRRESGRLMNDLALQNGLPAPHPHLLEVDDG